MSENFWLGLITTASALAGFTLASYSIFVTRIEIAGGDAICRKYSFKEDTSEYSLAFILFALAMFAAPTVLGLILLRKDSTGESSALEVRAIEGMLLVLVAILNGKQVDYGWRMWLYHKELLRKTKDLKQWGPEQMRRYRKRHVIFHWILGFVFLVLSWVFIVTNLYYIDKSLLSGRHAGKSLEVFISAEFGAAGSLLTAVALVSWYFYLFTPERMVFEVDAAVLLEARDNLVKSLHRVKPRVEWLKLRVETIQASLPPGGAETDTARKLADLARAYLEARVTGAGQQEETLEDRANRYHIPWLNFCAIQKFMAFGEIISLMNGIDLFVQAVASFEERLKEMPDQLASLLPVSESK